MQNERNKQLPPAQIVSLELLDYFVSICEKYCFKYVLVKDTGMGIHLQKGFLPWRASLTIVLLYNQLIEFMKVCESELKETPYYLITRNNTEQFDEFYIRMAKRSKVKLGNERKNDEKYYDFYINIVPAFYAGNTISEYRKIERAYARYNRLLKSRCIVPGMLKTGKRIIRQLKSSYYYHCKNPDDFKITEAILNKYKKPTKFIYVPNGKKNKGSVITTHQYTERCQYEFEGNQYYSVKDLEQYLIDFYGKKYKNKLDKVQINQAALEGPEILRRVQLIELDLLIEFDRICRKHNIKYMLGAGTLLGAVRHKGFIPWDDDIDVFMLYDEYEKFISIAKKELNHEKYFLKTQETDLDCNLTYIQLKRNGTKYSKGGRENFNTHPGILIDILPLFNSPTTRFGHWYQDNICKFYKTMTWAHIGAENEKKLVKRLYYRLLSKVPNKKSYKLFMKYATKIRKPSEKLTFFYVIRNFIENPANERRLYENLMEIEFEGHMFYATKYWDYYLKYSYSKDYMRYPIMSNRTQKHIPAVVDVANLYQNIMEEGDAYEGDSFSSR